MSFIKYLSRRFHVKITRTNNEFPRSNLKTAKPIVLLSRYKSELTENINKFTPKLTNQILVPIPYTQYISSTSSVEILKSKPKRPPKRNKKVLVSTKNPLKSTPKALKKKTNPIKSSKGARKSTKVLVVSNNPTSKLKIVNKSVIRVVKSSSIDPNKKSSFKSSEKSVSQSNTEISSDPFVNSNVFLNALDSSNSLQASSNISETAQILSRSAGNPSEFNLDSQKNANSHSVSIKTSPESNRKHSSYKTPLKWVPMDIKRHKLKSINSDSIERVPKLAHGLDEILFKPGYHFLKDPKTGVYSYPQFLNTITQPEDFDYSKLTPFIRPSQDIALHDYASSFKKKYVGSTSSMTAVMSQLYFLISNFKSADTHNFSDEFINEPKKFTRASRFPASIRLTRRDNIYSVDADKSFDTGNILMSLGKSMEKMLVSEQDEYEKFIKASLVEPSDNTEESYIYSTFNDFLLRSQLDCRDPRLKKSTFDLKTRAVVAIRLDIENYKETRGYQIVKDLGLLQSFEREYYDLIRSAFLKYNFQTRIGHMDGVFVAYHNTATIHGFQYISTKDMDKRLFGNTITGNFSFNSILVLYNNILNFVTENFPDKNSGDLTLWVEILNSKPNEDPEFSNSEPNEELSDSKPSQDISETTSDESSSSEKQNLDSILTESEYEIDPLSEIHKYSIKTRVYINDILFDGGYILNSNSDKVHISWSITEVHMSQPREVYKQFRNWQRTYFSRGRSKNNSNPFIKLLRRISKSGSQLYVTPEK
ncbi:mRNA degradation protein [Smittium mucronatum]|uniref:mRNA degradation protein n=1 Tax=Smittium mucronatum TaxID=133383 RepID=A0A1R0GTD2_9FUNG|nr:mRNA degradation protein [Smittium mucronatum]